MRTEDGSIIHECLNGESEAFGILVDKYKAGIYAFIYAKLRNFQDAQDVTQEVFLQAYRDLRSLRRWESFAFWLYRIASTRCGKWIRTQSRRLDREFIEDQDPRTLEAPSLNSYRDDLVNESLQEALDSLPETYREVLMLHYFGGMSSVEIARAVGTSPTAIRMRLSRARAQLKEEIIAMMSTTFEGQRLRASFTFRIVEAVKRIRIHPMPRMTGLPWGLSLAAGVILTVISLSPHLNLLNIMGAPMSSALPSETKVLEAGVTPVDMLEFSQTPIIASMQGDDDDGAPEMLQPAMMAAHGEADTWITKAGMPTERFGASTAVVDGKIYAIGGGQAPYTPSYLSTLEEYDPATDTWTTKADMPTARNGHAASVVNGKIYVIGGEPRAEASVPTVEEYDPAADTWTRKADMPTKRTFLSTCVLDGKIYAIGGIIAPELHTSSTVEVYDPATDTWTTKADIPTARFGLSTSVVDGKMYAIGGVIGRSVLGSGISTVEEYDPATDTWTRKANMPTGKKWLSTSVVDGKIYAIGGATGTATLFSAVEVYDPATDTWTRKADMPTPRCLHSTSALNGKIYAIGGDVVGWPWTPTATLEVYETGFVPLEEPSGMGMNSRGKLVKPWGEIKSD